MTFLGTENQLKKVLVKLDKRGLHYRIVYSGDARFASASPLSTLTRKQRQALLTAYSKGYFDFPRRIKSKELANSLGISQATLAQHLRKAEKRILENITSESPRMPE
jgi:predicted DNA binding protein